ncbi:phosphoribosylanthranilate isomerase [Methanobacterium oryzae]|uniref:phosphoribosylanthranilate isomerase n=1 Tax=Methanobacterium oryzae TaxID=69540 RepID=UPI003D233A3B
MKVKICGIMRSSDLKSLEKFDPHFIGFINIKRSKRFIDIAKINELMDKMENPGKAVLVLEPEIAEEVVKKANECNIKNVQLHSLSANEIAKINDINIIRAIGIPEKIDDEKKEEIEEFSKVCNYLLFDSMISGKSGGTGKQIPFKIAIEAAQIAKRNNNDIKLILAGGMNTQRMEDEGKIIKENFDYVDVNSGVEDSPGIKNIHKIEEFMEICKVI